MSRNTVGMLVFVLLVACGGAEPAPSEAASGENEGAESDRSVVVGARTGTGDACVTAGGSCVAVSECGSRAGHLGDSSLCGAPHLACCFTPVGSCGGPEDFACCDGSAEYRPTCREGSLQCQAGMTRAAPGSCPGT